MKNHLMALWCIALLIVQPQIVSNYEDTYVAAYNIIAMDIAIKIIVMYIITAYT